MKKISSLLAILLLVFLPETFARTGSSYQVSKSTITYTVDHPLKTAQGTSHAVKGKIVCAKPDNDCDFLFAVGIASFDSGNSNRDAHMKATVKEATFPIATVRGHVSNVMSLKNHPMVAVDLSGKQADYPLSDVDVKKTGKTVQLKAKFVLKLSSHGIERPSLLGASIKDEVPVDVQIELEEIE